MYIAFFVLAIGSMKVITESRDRFMKYGAMMSCYERSNPRCDFLKIWISLPVRNSFSLL